MIHVIVMAKAPVVGRVKTRLSRVGIYTAEQACGIYEAMLGCVLERVGRLCGGGRGPEGPRAIKAVLAVDEVGAMPGRLVPLGWQVVEQGAGDLGKRLERVWRAVGEGAVVFLGVDSPDVPAGHLRAALGLGTGMDAGVGPTGDGGYWALSAVRYLPGLVRGIDWGTPRVYDQTLVAGLSAGLRVVSLPGWEDVDEPADVLALARRLADHPDGEDPALTVLADRLACFL